MADTAASAFSGIGVWGAVADGDLWPFIDISGSGSAKNSIATTLELSAALVTRMASYGGSGAADSGKVARFGVDGHLLVGGSANGVGTNAILAKTGAGFGVQSTVYGNAGYAFEASVNGSPASWVAYSTHFNGTGIGFSFDGTGSAANSIAFAAYSLGAIFQSGTEDGTDTFGILRTGALEWYASGTNYLSGSDKTILTPATPSGTNTITVPAETGTLALRGANTFTGVQTFTPTARTSGSASYLTLTTPADTTLDATVEAIGVNFTAATRQFATGAIATQRERVFAAPTYSFVAASTITTAVNADFVDPIAGTNATLTNKWAVRAASLKVTGNATVDGILTIGTATFQDLGSGQINMNNKAYLAAEFFQVVGYFGLGGGLGSPDVLLFRDAAATLQMGADHATAATDQIFKAHDVTTGTGASLTLTGGKGSVAGGILNLATSETNGAPVTHFSIAADGAIDFATATANADAAAISTHSVPIRVNGVTYNFMVHT